MDLIDPSLTIILMHRPLLVQTLFDAILAEAMIAFRVDLRIGEMAQADDTYELLVNKSFQ